MYKIKYIKCYFVLHFHYYVSLPIESSELGLQGISLNSLDAVSDRDFVGKYLLHTQ